MSLPCTRRYKRSASRAALQPRQVLLTKQSLAGACCGAALAAAGRRRAKTTAHKKRISPSPANPGKPIAAKRYRVPLLHVSRRRLKPSHNLETEGGGDLFRRTVKIMVR